MATRKTKADRAGALSGSGLLLFGLFCLMPSLGFVAFRLVTPSDGARLSKSQDIFTAEGAVISTFKSAPGPLQDGDIVTSVEGVPMEAWGSALFTGRPERPAREFRRSIEYGLLRRGEQLTVQVPLIRLPWTDILAEHWGAILFAFVSQVVAVFVFLRRKHDPAARALFIWALSGSHTYAWSVFLGIGDLVGGTGFWLFRGATPLLWLIYWPASTHVALMFPRRLRVVRKFPLLIPALYLASLAIFSGGLAWTWARSENVLLWMNSWGQVDSVIAAIFLAASMAVIVAQYRGTQTAVEKQQIRWVIFGALVSGLGGLVLWIAAPLITGRALIDANVLGLLNLPFPISLGFAIWRYRLFDIDVIVRRTLQYSLTTVLLAGMYFLGVVLLQSLVGFLAGNPGSPLITVLTTLGIASLFNPVRLKVQEFIDRRFYRTSYDAELILESFAAAARDEVDIEVLSVALLGVVDETMQPRKIQLWIKG